MVKISFGKEPKIILEGKGDSFVDNLKIVLHDRKVVFTAYVDGSGNYFVIDKKELLNFLQGKVSA